MCSTIHCSKNQKFLEAQKAADQKKWKDVSINEVVKNKAFFEAEQSKVTAFEKNIEKLSSETNLLALEAQRQSMLDLLAESNLRRKRLTELKRALSFFDRAKAKVQMLECVIAVHQRIESDILEFL